MGQFSQFSSIRFDPATLEQIKAIRKATGLSQSEAIRKAIAMAASRLKG